MSQQCQHQRAAGKLHTFLKLSDGLWVHSLLLVSQTEVATRGKEIGIQVEYLRTLRNRFVVASRQVENPAQVGTGNERQRLELLRAFRFGDCLVKTFQRDQIRAVPLMGRRIGWLVFDSQLKLALGFHHIPAPAKLNKGERG